MKLRNTVKILLGIIVFLLALFFFAKFKQPEIIYIDDMTTPLSSEVYNLDFIKEVKNGEIITEKEKIDTSKTGKQSIEIEIKSFFKTKKKYSFEIEVIDDEKPTITVPEKIETTAGTEVDLLKDVTAKTSTEENIKVTVEGEYDLNKAGTYEITYVAKDSNGNETKKTVTIEVKEKQEETKPEEKKEEPKQEEPKKEEPKKEDTPKKEEQPSTVTTNDDGTFTTSKGFKGETKNGITYIDGILVVNKTYELPSTYSPNGLTQDTQAAANEMFAAARLEGLNMWAQSGFRSYTTQQKLYNNYVARDGKAAADRYSARPGHSEHQSGLAFDVCMSGYGCINSTFDNTPPANWLASNAYKYGFILRFPKGKENETGYLYESWHFRYVGKELAAKLYNNGDWITLESYFGITSQYNY